MDKFMKYYFIFTAYLRETWEKYEEKDIWIFLVSSFYFK